MVLLILAGITITALFGDNGLITRAKIADQKTQQGAQNDIDAIENLSQQANRLINGSGKVVEPTDIYVTLYTDGTLGFSNNAEIIEGKTVSKSYGNIKGKSYTFNYDEVNKEYDYSTVTPWYEDIANVQTAIFTNKIVPTNTAGWFNDCSNMTEIININNLDTRMVTNMVAMFCNCKSLTSLDLSNFKTSNVTDMSVMFAGCEELTSLDLSNFNTSNVTNMFGMFAYCASLTSLDLSNFNTSNVTEMGSMFGSCVGLTSLDLSSFNTSNVTNMSVMFTFCASLTSLDLSNFDTSKVTDMESMFEDCISLTNLDLSNFDTSKVTNMRKMFRECSNLTTIKVSTFDTSSVTDSIDMFKESSKLVGGNGTTYNSSYIDATYARIDAEGTPGYFTEKTNI